MKGMVTTVCRAYAGVHEGTRLFPDTASVVFPRATIMYPFCA